VISVKRLALIIGVGGVLMLGTASPASAAPLRPPGCFGQSVAAFATSEPRAVGNFVTTAIEGLNPPDTSIGTMVPDEKAAACD
jgi:hypothetical protein